MSLKTALAAAALLAACTLPVHAQTLRWAAQNDVLTLDPHSQNHATTNAILQHAYEGLVRFSAQYQVEPALDADQPDASPLRAAPRRQVPRRLALHGR